MHKYTYTHAHICIQKGNEVTKTLNCIIQACRFQSDFGNFPSHSPNYSLALSKGKQPTQKSVCNAPIRFKWEIKYYLQSLRAFTNIRREIAAKKKKQETNKEIKLF